MSGIRGCSHRLSPVTELKQYNRPLCVFEEHKTQFSGRLDSNLRRASASSLNSTSISQSDCKNRPFFIKFRFVCTNSQRDGLLKPCTQRRVTNYSALDNSLSSNFTSTPYCIQTLKHAKSLNLLRSQYCIVAKEIIYTENNLVLCKSSTKEVPFEQ